LRDFAALARRTLAFFDLLLQRPHFAQMAFFFDSPNWRRNSPPRKHAKNKIFRHFCLSTLLRSGHRSAKKPHSQGFLPAPSRTGTR